MVKKPNIIKGNKKTVTKVHKTAIKAAIENEKLVLKERLDKQFPIIGIGASAGGLAALEEFFSNIPKDKLPGMAFIIVQHLAPDHKSILNELIKKYTSMNVFEVTDGITVKSDCVYIIPPNRDMAYLNGTLQLLELDSPRGKRLSIDFFFRSLAQDLHQRAICIILSGTGSDGTLGAKAIKDEGGMVLAQKPESAEYDGMPRSAINTGFVDYILPPNEMPAQLIAYVNHFYIKAENNSIKLQGQQKDYLNKILVLLRSKSGHDFSLYKINTITRRIERRMAVNQIVQLEDYLRYLQNTPNEINLLFNDLLIGVTSFFRDKEAFNILEKDIIPKLFEGKSDNSIIRVWVPGCSTGEEAYSIAILLQEQKNLLNKSFKLQVFATDIDGKAIQQARGGEFSESIKADIDENRLSRYFIFDKSNNNYRIQKEIRDILIFSEHNVIKDPPFSNLGLISCRNMLIYFGPELQKKIIPLFHYAIKPGGFLFLGTSESIGDFINLFSIIDAKSKIYRLIPDTKPSKKTGVPTNIQVMESRKDISKLSTNSGNKDNMKISFKDIIERELLAQHSPASVIINKSGDILYLYGRTGLFLEPAQGESDMNVYKMAREGLKHVLISSVQKIKAGNVLITVPGIKVKTNGDYSIINLTVKKIQPDDPDIYSEVIYLITFQVMENYQTDKTENLKNTKIRGKNKNNSKSEIELLKQELNDKEIYLQGTLEAMETSNEELNSINEELQSVNEEFHSTNEELETSREELQSVNEELTTVNSELQQKVSDLSRSYNDMNNLLAGTDIGTIFIDNKLIIQRFTPAAANIINLISSDVGRPITHISSNLINYTALVDDIQIVNNTLIPKEIEVQSVSGTWYVLRIRPYRTIENVIEGVVITFFDITEIQKARNTILETEIIRHLALVVRDSSDAIIGTDLIGKIISWNPSAERIYGWNETEALKMNINELIPENLKVEEFSVLKSLVNSDVIKPYHTKRITKNKKMIEVITTVTALINDAGNTYGISSTDRIVSKNKEIIQ